MLRERTLEYNTRNCGKLFFTIIGWVLYALMMDDFKGKRKDKSKM